MIKSSSLVQQLHVLTLRLERQAPAAADLSALQAPTPEHRRLQASVEQLQELQSPTRQIEQYGSKLWHSEFIFLRDIQTLSGVTLSGAALRGYIWGKVIHSRFARFQMAFCHPGDFIVPRSIIDNLHSGRLPGRAELDKLSLLPCIVHPDLMPVNLLLGLNFLPQTYPTLSKFDQIVARGKLSVLTGLKLVVEEALPLAELQRRAFVIMPRAKRLPPHYPRDLPKLKPEAIGTILILRGNNRRPQKEAASGRGSETPLPRFAAELHRSPYSTYRQYQHIPRNYQAERHTMARCAMSLAAFVPRITNTWGKGSRSADDNLRLELKAKLGDAQTFLARRKASGLAEARDEVTKLLNDGLTPETNPTQLITSLHQILGGFRTREGNQARIQSRLKGTEFRLGTYTEQVDLFFDAYFDALIAAHRRVIAEPLGRTETDRTNFITSLNLDPLAFAKALHEVNFSGKQPEAIANFTDAAEFYPGLALRPYRLYLDKLSQQHTALTNAATQNDSTALEHAMVTAAIIVKFHRVTATFARMCDIAAQPTTQTFQNLIPIIEELQHRLSTKEIFPQHATPQFDVPFRDLRREVQRIHAACTVRAKLRDLKQIAERLAAMKDFFAKLDLEKRFLKLPI